MQYSARAKEVKKAKKQKMKIKNSTDGRVAATLRLGGLKATRSRQEILSLFSYGCKPLSADTIYKKLALKINRASVFRTLSSLAQAGILEKIDLRKDAAFYELKSLEKLHKHTEHKDQHHHHIVCLDCGKIESFKNCSVDAVSKKILKKSFQFKTITEHSLELFGMCVLCAKK